MKEFEGGIFDEFAIVASTDFDFMNSVCWRSFSLFFLKRRIISKVIRFFFSKTQVLQEKKFEFVANVERETKSANLKVLKNAKKN